MLGFMVELIFIENKRKGEMSVFKDSGEQSVARCIFFAHSDINPMAFCLVCAYLYFAPHLHSLTIESCEQSPSTEKLTMLCSCVYRRCGDVVSV